MLDAEQFKNLMSGDIGPDVVLNSIFEIENVLLMIKSLNDKKEFYKQLKAHRAMSIDEKINQIEEKEASLRGVILHTMKQLEPNKTNFNFPSIGTVIKKKNPNRWTVAEEEALKAFLEKQGYKSEVYPTREVLDSRRLKRVLDDFDNAQVTVPGVQKISGEESITIKYEKEGAEKEVHPAAEQMSNAVDLMDGITAEDL